MKKSRDLDKGRLYWFVFCAAALISLFFVYARSLQFFFWQDDFNLLEFVGSEPLAEYVRISFTKPTHILPLNLGVVFRPIPHYIYFKTGRVLFGLNPLPYRLLNMFWHFLSGVLVAKYCQMISKNTTVGFVAGLLFVISRVYLTPIYWISANNEIAVTFFVLLSVIGYLEALGQGKKGWVYLWISYVGLVLALLSKESAVVLPALIALSVLLRFDSSSFRDRLHACLRLWPHLLIVLVFLASRALLIVYALSGGGESYYSISNLPQLATSYLWGFWWNLETFVEPWRTILDGLTRSFSLFQPLYLSGVGMILTLFGAIWLIKESGRANAANPVWLGLAWYVISALPALVTGILTAYLFSLPTVGFVMVMAYLVESAVARVWRESITKRGASFAILLMLSVVSARLVVLSLEKTTWPVRYMPLAVETLEVAQQQFFDPDSNQTVCLVDFPTETWWPGRLQAAFHVFVSPAINVLELTTEEFDGEECPFGAPQLKYINNGIVVYQPRAEGQGQ
jgi:hypothetical protein